MFFAQVLILASVAVAQQPNVKLAAAMKTAMAAYDQARSPAEVQQVANQWERIANAEPGQWLPAYWTTYTYLMLHYRSEDDKVRETALDKTGEWMEKTEKMQDSNDEVAILAAWYYQARLGESPATGWARFGGKVSRNIDKAKQLNPENPRVYLVEGQNIYYTPSAFGGGKEKALLILKAGDEKFAKFVPVSDFHPNWGKSRLDKLITACQSAN